MEQKLREKVASFRVPEYAEIPDVGLFLEQVTKYISGYLRPFSGFTVTGSMISNYVKRDLIANPVKKQYGREQIAYLFFIVIAKTVLSLEDIQLIIHLQRHSYSAQVAYDYFRLELENVLNYVFGLRQELDAIGTTQSVEISILRNTITAVANKVYVDESLLESRNRRGG